MRHPRLCIRSGDDLPGSSRLERSFALLALMAAALACSGRAAPRALREPLPAPPRVVSPAADPESKFETGFADRLREADGGETVRALVDLSEQLDLARFTAELRSAGLSKARRRDAVIAGLEEVAREQQARLMPVVDLLQEAGRIDYVRPVAIVNRLLVEGTASAILELSGSSEVSRIAPEWTSERRGGSTAATSGTVVLGETFQSWAIAAMGVEELWERGLDGSGVIVATIDTGAYGAHEQLRGRELPDGRGWFDPVSGSTSPNDSHGHGTGVLSVAVGGNPGGRVIGIAPGARWASALGNWKNYYSRWRMTEAADWVLRVARPDVLINAWSDDISECSDFNLAFINAWKAAEIFVVFPAGNAGPAPSTGEAPASLTGTFPENGPVFSVAALMPGGDVTPTSSRGPSRCGSLTFPSVGAPGEQLPMAARGRPTAYTVGGGTSLAAGLVGGAAALILQADPELSPHEVEAVLLRTARPLPSPGGSNAIGAGGVDLRGIVGSALAHRETIP